MSRTTMTTSRAVFTLVMLLATAACYEHTYTAGAGAPQAPVVYERWHNHWIAGLISPDQEIELEQMCPSGNATIHEEVTFLNGLVSALTAEIYAPTTVEVRCDDRSADFEFSADDVEGIVTSADFVQLIATIAPALLEDAEAPQ